MSDRFTMIKNKYIGTFSDKQDEIKSAWDNKDIAHVHDLMHKLAGSSGGYGFDELYQLVLKGMELTENNQVVDSEAVQECLEQIYATFESIQAAESTI